MQLTNISEKNVNNPNTFRNFAAIIEKIIRT